MSPFFSRRTRLFAPPLAALLAVGTLVALATPASAVRTTFSNNGGVAIADPIDANNGNATITINDNAAATPYPSTINVVESGEITDVNVFLFNINHNFPDDIDVLLVGPGGQQVTLMSDAGGGFGTGGASLFFDDAAANSLPDNTAITTGTYKPSNYDTVADPYPAPAPTSTGATSLAVFNGTQAQGAWKLYVVDDDAIISGAITSGWAINMHVKSVPYPSTINVSGLGTKVSDVNVTLGNLTHTFPDDIDVLLVGPGGQAATIMSDVGSGFDISNVNLVLDDAAVASLPDATQITSGTYKPTNIVEPPNDDSFPPPAPAASGASALSVFNGTNPNGTWSLYVIDDASTDQGTLGNWSLDIETDNTPPTGTVSVNSGHAFTTSKAVTLNLSATDPGSPSSGVAEMRFSNDGVTFSAYQPFAATASWTLSNGDGTKHVFAQFRDGSGIESTVVSDTIKLDTTGPKAKRLNPKNHAKAVKTTTNVKIVASEKLKKSTVTGSHVFIKGPSGKVAAKVTYTGATKTITIEPKAPLHHGTKYTVTVSGVTDKHGLKWDEKPKAGVQALKFSFTTA